ncbi:response regulator transcription factor, partial [Halomonas sp. Alg239-R46]
ELMARLKALLRRQSGQLSQVITLNGISLDEAGQRVCLEGETWRSLTATEFRLLRYLMLHPDRIHSKEQLLEQLYALDQDAAAPNLVEVYVARLRRYLGKTIIQTRRGQGYFFASH